MRSDSKLDGIKHKQVIVTQACLRSRQRRANYVYVSASVVQIWSWGRVGGASEIEKKCAHLWKNPGYAPDFPQCHLCFCSEHLYLIISGSIFNDANHL